MKITLAAALVAALVAPLSAAEKAMMDDAQVLQTIKAANDSEVAAAKTAVKKAKSEDVRAFAQHMIDEHTRNNADLAALSDASGSKQQQVASVPKKMKDESAQQLRKLQTMKGESFDQAYMKQQTEAHQKLLDTLDQALSSRHSMDESTVQFVTKTRGAVQSHLEDAQKIQTQLKPASRR